MTSWIKRHTWIIAPLTTIITVIVSIVIGWSTLRAETTYNNHTLEDHDKKIRELEIHQAETSTSLKYIVESLDRIEVKLDRRR